MKKGVKKGRHGMPRGLAIAMGREHSDPEHEGRRKSKKRTKKTARRVEHRVARRAARR